MRFRDGELGLIRRISDLVGGPQRGVVRGIGDDTAVLEFAGGRLLATVDMLVEGVHFDLAFIKPWQLGRKALAVNLSDIAAMGGEPLFALVSLGVGGQIDEDFVREFYKGMVAMAGPYGVQIVGGDTVRSPGGLVVDVAVLGRAAEHVTRSGARPGDLVAVTGSLGASAVGLHWLLRQKEGRPGVFIDAAGEDEVVRTVVRSHLEPEPRVREAAALAATGLVTAMIDISDGLASEVNHIARESEVGMVIYAGAIPVAAATREVALLLGADPLEWALAGGEDYELLLTCVPGSEERLREAVAATGTPLTFIGKVVPAERGVTLVGKDGAVRPLEPAGYDHLRGG
ncbi:MAG: thiamine-phosphate kinase [Desulfotomaculales bacterium]